MQLPVTSPAACRAGRRSIVGRNPGSSVSKLYGPPFAFTGTIFKVTVDVSGQKQENAETERNAAAVAAMKRQ